MKLITFFCLASITAYSSCKGQSAGQASEKHIVKAVGDTVSALSNSILIVFQGSDGKYWFGSDKDGLYCVDCRTIIHYSIKDGLSNNRIRSIQEDKRGNIYVSSLGGIYKFDGKMFSTLTAVESTSSADNWKLQPDDLWFSMAGKNGEKGAYRYDGKNLYQLYFPKHYMEDEYFASSPNKAWSPYEVYYIYKDHSGSMWFGTSNFGVCRYDGKSFSWLYEDHLTLVPNGGSFGIRSIIEDRKGAFWICNTRYRFRIASGSIKEHGKTLVSYNREKGISGIHASDGADGVYFMSAVEDGKGDLWMATSSQGVWRYDGSQVTHYDVKGEGGAVTLFSIYKDAQGGLWLGSHESGVFKFNGISFERFSPGA